MEHYEYIILGAGPAGLQLGYYFKKAGINYCILEKENTVGSFFNANPRHDTLISINKVHTGFNDPEINLRWDWHSILTDDNFRFTNYTTDFYPDKKFYLQYLHDFQKRYKLHILFNRQITNVSRQDDNFILETENKESFKSRRLIIATGLFNVYTPAIPGLEHASNYNTMSLNKKEYENKRVLILGKGNSGFETANHLVDSASLIHVASPNPLTMAWRSHFVGHLRSINNTFLDTYQLKMLNAVINADVKKIEQKGGQLHVTFHYTLAGGEVESIHYDHVINCMGFKFDSSIFSDDCKPALTINNKFPDMTSYYESKNLPNLYFAGSLMQMRDYKKKQSGFIHGFRYNVQFLFHYLLSRYENRPLPHTKLKLEAKEITDTIITQVNQTSALWQQTGYLCDLIVLNKNENEVDFYKSLPADYLRHFSPCSENAYLTVTLEFGQHLFDEAKNVFALERVAKDDVENADKSFSLHPVVRHYNKDGGLLSTHHLIEDFDSVWNEPVHIKPLQHWLTQLIEKDKVPTQETSTV